MRGVLKSAALLLVVGLGVVAVQVYINNAVLPDFLEPPKGELNSFDQKAIDISIETVRNLTSMATLIFGAVGAVWFTRYSTSTIPAKVWRFGLTAAISAALSIYFGFIFERNMVTMLKHRLVTLDTGWLVWPLYLEATTFLLSLFAVGVVIFEGKK